MPGKAQLGSDGSSEDEIYIHLSGTSGTYLQIEEISVVAHAAEFHLKKTTTLQSTRPLHFFNF